MGSADQGMLKQTFWNICERMVWAARCNRSELLLSLRKVRKACLQNIPEESSAQSIVPVPSNLITSNTNSAIEITIGKIQITVSDATSPALLKMVLQVAADVK